MLRSLATAVMVILLAVALAIPALADHNGPYCQAEELSDDRVAFETEAHDYCD